MAIFAFIIYITMSQFGNPRLNKFLPTHISDCVGIQVEAELIAKIDHYQYHWWRLATMTMDSALVLPLFNQQLFPNPLFPQGPSHLVRPADNVHLAQRAEVRKCVLRYIALLINILLAATSHILIQEIPDDPEPYHTSALTGQEWVMELIVGHPECIRCELGVHAHIFEHLINDLRSLGHNDSRHVSLEEQLAILLYTCVTGLTVRHVGEWFQWSNETISRFVVLAISQTQYWLLSQVFPKNSTHFCVPPILYDTHMLSHQGHTCLQPNSWQSKMLAVLQGCHRSNRWQSHSRIPPLIQPPPLLQPKRLHFSELFLCMRLWPQFYICTDWLGGICDGWTALGCRSQWWLEYPTWKVSSCWFGLPIM